MHLSRGLLVLSFLILGLTLVSSAGGASDVPAELQAELLGKVVRYDRNFDKRAGDVAVVLILVKAKNATSSVAASVTKSAFGRIDKVGGRDHREAVVEFKSAAAVAERVKQEHASIVYVTPGFEEDVPALSAALTGVDVLSVAGNGSYVTAGVVLGFELVLGKPKMVLNLPQARKQNVDFGADVLRLMKVER